MGYRRIPTIYTLDSIPEEEGLIVRVKAIRLGKLRRLMKLTSGDGDEGIEEMLELLQEALVSWNLEDEEGLPVPTTVEGIDAQEIELVMNIISSWTDQMTGPSVELGKDSTSGEKFPGQPLTMEVL